MLLSFRLSWNRWSCIWKSLAEIRAAISMSLRTRTTSSNKRKYAAFELLAYKNRKNRTFWSRFIFRTWSTKIRLNGANMKRVAKKLFTTRFNLFWLKRVYIFCIWAAGCAGMKFGRGWLKDCTTAMSLKIWKFWWARCLRNCLPRGYG